MQQSPTVRKDSELLTSDKVQLLTATPKGAANELLVQRFLMFVRQRSMKVMRGRGCHLEGNGPDALRFYRKHVVLILQFTRD